MLYVIIILLLAAIFLLSVHLWSAKKELQGSQMSEDFWFKKWMEEIESHVSTDEQLRLVSVELVQSKKDYKALEQGRDEESEAYEMQFLSFSERIEQQDNLILALEEIRKDHDVFCLPWLGLDFYPNAEEEESPVYDALIFERIG